MEGSRRAGASPSRPKIKAIAEEIAKVKAKREADSIAPADANILAKQLDGLLTRLNPQKLTGGEPNEIGSYVSQVKSLKERLQGLRAKPTPAAGSDAALDADAEGEDGAGNGDGGAGETGGSQSDDGRNAGASDDAQGDGGSWTSDELLAALLAVIERELGADETQRLFDLALEDLESG